MPSSSAQEQVLFRQLLPSAQVLCTELSSHFIPYYSSRKLKKLKMKRQVQELFYFLRIIASYENDSG